MLHCGPRTQDDRDFDPGGHGMLRHGWSLIPLRSAVRPGRGRFQNGEASLILSKVDYDAITETAYLLRNPANAERLLTAIERVRRGEFEQHDLTTE